jgi:hypothetical protein
MTCFGKMMLRAGLATMAVGIAGNAQATEYLFTMTGLSNASWQLDSNPIPILFGPSNFSIFSVPVSYGGAPVLTSLQFNTATSGGGVFGTGPFTSTGGPQLFSGPTSAPTFLQGTFDLSGGPRYPQFTLTISALTTSGAVPEPASWAMMIAGFGLVGGAMRRRRGQTVKVGYAA